MFKAGVDQTFVWRLYDPAEGLFCASGRGLYAHNGRTVWMSKAGAASAMNHLPAGVRDRVEVRRYVLVDATDKGEAK